MIPAWLVGGGHERQAHGWLHQTGPRSKALQLPKEQRTSSDDDHDVQVQTHDSCLTDNFTTCEVRPWTIQERPCVCQSPVLGSKARSRRDSSGRTRPACFSATSAFRISVDVARRSRRWVLEPLLVLLLYHHHWSPSSCDHQTEWSCEGVVCWAESHRMQSFTRGLVFGFLDLESLLSHQTRLWKLRASRSLPVHTRRACPRNGRQARPLSCCLLSFAGMVASSFLHSDTKHWQIFRILSFAVFKIASRRCAAGWSYTLVLWKTI